MRRLRPRASGGDKGQHCCDPPRHFVIVMFEVSDFPSLVAVTTAVPSFTPVTTPVDDTVALLVSLDTQVTTRPVSIWPFASRSVAVSATVFPFLTDADDGVTVTVATGSGAAATTVMLDVPDFPSLVAVIVAVPGATACTNPLTDTVATAELLVVQLTARPLSGLPSKSFGVAVSCCDCPCVMLAVAGLTATLATGISETLTAAEPLFPSLVAVMVALPGRIPVTRPFCETDATPGLFVLHVT